MQVRILCCLCGDDPGKSIVNQPLANHKGLANHWLIFDSSAAKAFDRMKDLIAKRKADETENVEWIFLGHRVCLRGWKSLHCLGTLAEIAGKVYRCDVVSGRSPNSKLLQ